MNIVPDGFTQHPTNRLTDLSGSAGGSNFVTAPFEKRSMSGTLNGCRVGDSAY